MKMEPMIVLSMAIGTAFGGVRSGHATAELLQSSEGYTPGSPVEVALRLELDEGWHTYWINPGEGGMPVSIEWSLPEGWVAGPMLHPVPGRFQTGDLAGFGYAEEVVIPVFLTAAPEGAGDVEVKAEVSWLTCDEGACVSGDAELELSFSEGTTGPGPEATAIAAALKEVPHPIDGASLKVAVRGGRLQLELGVPAGIDPAGCEVFPATPTVVDPGEPIRFEKDGGHWKAEVAANEYADGPPKQLELVLVGGKLDKPVLVSWKAD